VKDRRRHTISSASTEALHNALGLYQLKSCQLLHHKCRIRLARGK